jgi:hypothetical protein
VNLNHEWKKSRGKTIVRQTQKKKEEEKKKRTPPKKVSRQNKYSQKEHTKVQWVLMPAGQRFARGFA